MVTHGVGMYSEHTQVWCLALGYLSHFLPVSRIEPATFRSDSQTFCVIYVVDKCIIRTVWSFADVLASGCAGFIIPSAVAGALNLPTILIICPVVRLTLLPIPAIHTSVFLSWGCEFFNPKLLTQNFRWYTIDRPVTVKWYLRDHFSGNFCFCFSK